MQSYKQDIVPAKLFTDASKALNEIGKVVGSYTNMRAEDAAELQVKVRAVPMHL
jgi:hypothetical protein